MSEKKLYRLNDEILFRVCSLCDCGDDNYGDCTNFDCKQVNWCDYYTCKQYGIHYHCAKHPELELSSKNGAIAATLYCPKCKSDIHITTFSQLMSDCLKLLNQEKFKGAQLIKLDDWYIPEIKEKIKCDSKYWLTTNIKTDKDGDTIVVLYIGHSDNNEKSQFFIKPEKGQLTSDHKDLDPAKIISKIEVTLKDRKLIQEFNDKDN